MAGEGLTSRLTESKLMDQGPKDQNRYTLKRRQICVPVGLMLKGPWSRATFLTRESIHYSKKRFIIRQKHTCIKEENFNILGHLQ